MSKTIRDSLGKAVEKLRENSETPHLDAEVLLSFVLNKKREKILTHIENKISNKDFSKFQRILKRRQKNEPVAYILGKKEFYNLNFKVSRDTLIPRPETETLIEEALKKIKSENLKNKIILDVGTGSGNIIISLTKNIIKGNSKLYGLDISKKALDIAKLNSKKNKVDKKIIFLQGNLLEPIIKKNEISLSSKPHSLIIIANLPYLSKKNYDSLSENVKNYEPKVALYSSNNGLGHYEKMFRQIKKLRKNENLVNFFCFLEISPEQKNHMRNMVLRNFPQAKIETKKDLLGKWRFFCFRA